MLSLNQWLQKKKKKEYFVKTNLCKKKKKCSDYFDLTLSGEMKVPINRRATSVQRLLN